MEIDNVKSLLDAGRALGQAEIIEGRPYTVVPQNHQLIDLEAYLPAPTRKRGHVKVDDVASFLHYILAHKEKGAVIFAKATPSAANYVCILNHHDEGAQWGDHRVSYAPVPTVEWLRWRDSDRKKMGQVEFAEFLEANERQIVEPGSAKLVELALTLQAKTEVKFESGVKLQNGNIKLTFEENTTATAGVRGDIEIPSEFTLGVILFEGTSPYALKARLRYRIDGKQLSFWYELVNPHLVVKDAFDGIHSTISNGTNGTVQVLNGEPPTK